MIPFATVVLNELLGAALYSHFTLIMYVCFLLHLVIIYLFISFIRIA